MARALVAFSVTREGSHASLDLRGQGRSLTLTTSAAAMCALAASLYAVSFGDDIELTFSLHGDLLIPEISHG